MTVSKRTLQYYGAISRHLDSKRQRTTKLRQLAIYRDRASKCSKEGA